MTIDLSNPQTQQVLFICANWATERYTSAQIDRDEDKEREAAQVLDFIEYALVQAIENGEVSMEDLVAGVTE